MDSKTQKDEVCKPDRVIITDTRPFLGEFRWEGFGKEICFGRLEERASGGWKLDFSWVIVLYFGSIKN